MTGKRTYDDGCAMAHALDLVGERWALLVVRELLFGPRRFSDLRGSLPGISPNVLSQRLKDLEEIGVLRRSQLAPPAAAWVYGLTEWGRELEPILQQLGRWGARSPAHDPAKPISLSTVLSAQKTMFDPEQAGAFEGTLALHLGREDYVVTVKGGQLDLQPGTTKTADVNITTSVSALGAAIFGGVPISELESAGQMTVQGASELFQRYVTFFPLPEKAEG